MWVLDVSILQEHKILKILGNTRVNRIAKLEYSDRAKIDSKLILYLLVLLIGIFFSVSEGYIVVRPNTISIKVTLCQHAFS